MEINSVIFDYGGVLCLHPTDAQVNELAETCGVSSGEFLQAYWSTRVPYDRGDLDPHEYWRDIAHRLGKEPYDDATIERCRALDIGFWVTLDNRMVDWARRLHAARIRTAVLSNLPPDLGAYMRSNMDLLTGFDAHTFSYELRTVKPDAAIYEDCVKKLAADPAKTLFLDDRPDNVRGAREVGLNAVVFESPKQLADELERLAGDSDHSMPFGATPIFLE